MSSIFGFLKETQQENLGEEKCVVKNLCSFLRKGKSKKLKEKDYERKEGIMECYRFFRPLWISLQQEKELAKRENAIANLETAIANLSQTILTKINH
jgi:hypothetical protein